MGQHDLRVELEFAVSRERLWEALVDHRSMGKWIGAPVRVLRDGDERGVGAVRRIGWGPVGVDEAVVYGDPPTRLVYRVVRGGLITHHRGEVLLEARPGGCRLRWDVRLKSIAPGLGTITAGLVRRALVRGLNELRGRIGG